MDTLSDSPVHRKTWSHRLGRSPYDRLMARVEVSPSGCWEVVTTKPGRYANVRVAGKNVKAHRFMWEHVNGPMPGGLVPDHTCRNTRCVNPDHLDAVPQRINVLRGNGPTATNAAKTHCDRGHELAGENVYTYPGGRRECKTCARAYKEEWYAHNREAILTKSRQRCRKKIGTC